MGNITSVSIDFQTSHLVFPTLVGALLALLGLAILVRDRHRIAASGGMWARTFHEMDKRRFFGALGLTLVYFLAMVPVGDVWPNTGYGFLICSVPYILSLGFLFMHERTRSDVIATLVMAAVAPPVIWWLFSEIFFLTLP